MPCSSSSSATKMKGQAGLSVESMPRLWTFAPAHGMRTAENFRSAAAPLIRHRAFLSDSCLFAMHSMLACLLRLFA